MVGGPSPPGTPTLSALALPNADGEQGTEGNWSGGTSSKMPAESFRRSCFIICYLILRKEVEHQNALWGLSKGTEVKEPRPRSLPQNQPHKNRDRVLGSLAGCPHSKDTTANPICPSSKYEAQKGLLSSHRHRSLDWESIGGTGQAPSLTETPHPPPSHLPEEICEGGRSLF